MKAVAAVHVIGQQQDRTAAPFLLRNPKPAPYHHRAWLHGRPAPRRARWRVPAPAPAAQQGLPQPGSGSPSVPAIAQPPAEGPQPQPLNAVGVVVVPTAPGTQPSNEEPEVPQLNPRPGTHADGGTLPAQSDSKGAKSGGGASGTLGASASLPSAQSPPLSPPRLQPRAQTQPQRMGDLSNGTPAVAANAGGAGKPGVRVIGARTAAAAARAVSRLWPVRKSLLLRNAWDIAAFALPLATQNVLGYSLNVVSGSLVGRLGAAPLSASTLANSAYSLAGLSLVCGGAAGMETLCGQAYGAGNMRLMRLLLLRAVLVSWAVCLAVVSLWGNAEGLLRALGQSPALVAQATAYLHALAPSMFFYVLSDCLQSFLVVQGLVRPTIVAKAIVTVLGPLYYYVLMFWMDMGLVGAGHAYTLYKASNALLLLGWMAWRALTGQPLKETGAVALMKTQGAQEGAAALPTVTDSTRMGSEPAAGAGFGPEEGSVGDGGGGVKRGLAWASNSSGGSVEGASRTSNGGSDAGGVSGCRNGSSSSSSSGGGNGGSSSSSSSGGGNGGSSSSSSRRDGGRGRISVQDDGAHAGDGPPGSGSSSSGEVSYSGSSGGDSDHVTSLAGSTTSGRAVSSTTSHSAGHYGRGIDGSNGASSPLSNAAHMDVLSSPLSVPALAHEHTPFEAIGHSGAAGGGGGGAAAVGTAAGPWNANARTAPAAAVAAAAGTAGLAALAAGAYSVGLYDRLAGIIAAVGADVADVLEPRACWEYVKFSLPAAFMVCLEWWACEALVIMAGWLPDADVALGCLGICITVGGWAYMVPQAIAQAACARVANALGAGDAVAAKRNFQASYGLVLLTQLAIGCCLLLHTHRVAAFFCPDPATAALTAALLPITAAHTIGDGMSCVLNGTLRACGRQALGARLHLLSYWCCGLPLGYLAAFKLGLGVRGFAAAVAATSFVQSLLVLALISRWDWQGEVRNSQALLSSISTTSSSCDEEP